MSKTKKPKQPDVSSVGNQQFQLGKKAARFSQKFNALPMSIPGQSISYDYGKKGRIKGVNVGYDPANQQAFNTASAQRNVFLDQLPDQAFSEGDQSSINAVRKAYYDKGLADIEPGLKRAEDANRLQLTERGIPIGAEIYNEEGDRLAQNRGNALTTLSQNADLAAGAEADRLLAHELTVRNQPFNELSAYTSSYPMQPVSYPSMQSYSVSAPDISTPQYNQYKDQQEQYQNDQGGLWGGILGLGKTALTKFLPAAGVLASDERVKKDIKLVGKTNGGHNVYTFRYKYDDSIVHMGVMAQEVEKISPEAVYHTPEGMKLVDYAAIT